VRTFKVREIATEGLPDMESLVGRVAFIFDGCIVSGWPLNPNNPDINVYALYDWDAKTQGILWEANSDVGHTRPFGNVTHWIEFDKPVWEFTK
jgi:hypothetical protein